MPESSSISDRIPAPPPTPTPSSLEELLQIIEDGERRIRGVGSQQIDSWAAQTVDEVMSVIASENATAALIKLDEEASEILRSNVHPRNLNSKPIQQEFATAVSKQLQERGVAPELAAAYGLQNLELLDANTPPWSANWGLPRGRNGDGVIDRKELATEEQNLFYRGTTFRQFLNRELVQELERSYSEIQHSHKDTVGGWPIVGWHGHERDVLTREDLEMFLAKNHSVRSGEN